MEVLIRWEMEVGQWVLTVRPSVQLLFSSSIVREMQSSSDLPASSGTCYLSLSQYVMGQGRRRTSHGGCTMVPLNQRLNLVAYRPSDFPN